jgi:hypothetical protein
MPVRCNGKKILIKYKSYFKKHSLSTMQMLFQPGKHIGYIPSFPICNDFFLPFFFCIVPFFICALIDPASAHSVTTCGK